MHRICAFVVSILFSLSLVTGAFAAEYKKEYRLNVVPDTGEGWCWGMAAVYFANLVKAKSDNRINIKVYGNSKLTSGMQTSEFLLVRNGTIDFTLASTINWSPQVQELNLPSLPFFISHEPDRYKAIDAIEAGQAGKMMIAAVEKKGVHFIGWAENGYRELTTNKKVTCLADLKDMKIRVVGSPIFIDIFRALGANPESINWGNAVRGFKLGTIEGQENPMVGMNIPAEVWQHHKFHYDWHYLIDPLMLCSNLDVWKSFTPEDQKIIIQCAKEMELYSKALARLGQDPKYLEYLKKINMVPKLTDPFAFLKEHGVTITYPTKEQLDEFYKATEEVRKKWAKKIGQKIVDAAIEDMAKVR